MTKGAVMNAIELLESQHREVEDLFSKLETTKDAAKKEQLFTKLADSLAIHTAIEEHNFYPGVKAKETEDLLLESLEEHLEVKRALSDLLDLDVEDPTFDAKVKVLKEQVENHVEEEEGQLFPKVKKLLDTDELEALGQTMSAEQAELEEKGNAREAVPAETDEPARI
jgi:hemerythrin superfamily protein